MIHETVRYAAEGRWHQRQYLVGEPLSRTLTGRESGIKVTVKSPDGSEHTIRPLVGENRTEINFAATIHPGIYEMALESPAEAAAAQASTSSGPDKSASAVRHEFYAVNVDPRESDLEMVDEKTLQTSTLAGVPYDRRGDWTHESRELGASEPLTSGLSRWLLVAMLALLLVEPLLAWNFRQGFVVLCAFGDHRPGIPDRSGTSAICGGVRRGAGWRPFGCCGHSLVARSPKSKVQSPRSGPVAIPVLATDPWALDFAATQRIANGSNPAGSG